MNSPPNEEYVCTLDGKYLKKAKDELNENESDRKAAVEALREWLIKQKYLKFHTDTPNLLRILRHTKFSQIKARETIELVVQTALKNPEISFNLDTADEKFISFIKLGPLFFLPGHDDFGRKVLVYKQNAYPLDELMKKYPFLDLIKYWRTFFLSYVNDDMFQVNGLVMIIDMTDCSLKTMASLRNPDLIKWQKENQIRVHDTLESVYDSVPKRMLPLEYLPDDYSGPSGGTIKEIIDENIERLKSEKCRTNLLKYSDKSKYYYDKTKKEKDSIPVQHFRKLNVE
ncbi:DgyrCDS10720 [Dimorphilus gyrociliatus]|uniref:DgyrCDS10720 n=1 Tax=Dimorphilus gyrociliatus TaxID=2664684 RepID=A0A7I8W2G5_9ANNE|nr:DgyrCDS10720 [Dimorphilus gyrociliatus]